MTTADWIKEYEKNLANLQNCADDTVRSYVGDIERLHQWASATGMVDWSNFTEEMTLSYVEHLKAVYRDTSAARAVYAFRNFFKFLRRRGLVMANPWEEIIFHHLNKPLPRFLNIDEMNQLLSRVREPIEALRGIPQTEVFLTIRDRAMFEVLYSAAVRVSELVGLNWEDIDWQAREVHVLGKRNKERVCPLGQWALDGLAEYARHYEDRFGQKAEGSHAVFMSHWNRRIVTRSIPRTIRKWLALAGVKRTITPHGFRHSAATHMLENGADLRMIQQLLGHASIITTEIYTHVATRKLRAVHANTHPRG